MQNKKALDSSDHSSYNDRIEKMEKKKEAEYNKLRDKYDDVKEICKNLKK